MTWEHPDEEAIDRTCEEWACEALRPEGFVLMRPSVTLMYHDECRECIFAAGVRAANGGDDWLCDEQPLDPTRPPVTVADIYNNHRRRHGLPPLPERVA